MIDNTLYIVNNISLPIHASFKEAFSVAGRRFRKAGINVSTDSMFVFRRSIDSRNKRDIRFVYSVGINAIYPVDSSILSKYGISAVRFETPGFIECSGSDMTPISVVGSGPAGLFCALALAENGYKVTLLERGGCLQDRVRAVRRFEDERILDVNSNIQFGAGGAGTFSDGKLVTRVNDPLSAYVISELVRYGAPKEIKYVAKPHIGTDVLCGVVDNIIHRLKDLGVSVLFNTEFLDFESSDGSITSIKTSNGDIACSGLVLAIGHSARDTILRLLSKGVTIEAKDFSVGMRIEHPKSVIERGLYGDMAGDPILPAGEYNLSYNTKARGVYTFCMCPGGVVVPAASEMGGVVVNGMSYNARNGDNSNSAVCCSVFKSDYGATPEAAIDFQRQIERRAFELSGGNYSAPIITVGDFLTGKCVTAPTTVKPSYMNGNAVAIVDPSTYLPAFVVSNIRNGLIDFDRKIPNFAMSEAVLTGPETRTSSPVRILRNNDTRLAFGYSNLYPTGEGAGYAGGITSAAIDGIRTALSIMKNLNR